MCDQVSVKDIDGAPLSMLELARILCTVQQDRQSRNESVLGQVVIRILMAHRLVCTISPYEATSYTKYEQAIDLDFSERLA